MVRPADRDTDTGFPTDYTSEPRLVPRVPPSRIHEHLDFGWLEAFRSSYPIFKRLREERGQPALKFQVGLPTGIGITFSIMSPLNALRYAPGFDRRMALEANAILDEADDGDVVFQLEVPGNLAMAYQLPAFLHRFPASGVIRLLRQVRPEAPFGVHLCFGDLNNEALIKAGSIHKAVQFTNALVARWPSTHELAYVHFPLAEAAAAPPLEAAHYAPLAQLRLPQGVRFAAGFVHPGLSDDDHATLLGIVEQHRGRPVDVACSCGLGRTPRETAERMLRVSASLVEEGSA